MNFRCAFRFLSGFSLLLILSACNGNINNWTEMLILTERVSKTNSGFEAMGPSENPSISYTGSHVAFESNALNLASGGVTASGVRINIYVVDTDEDTVKMITTNWDGSSQPNKDCKRPVISEDGSFIAFQSKATDLLHAPDPAKISGNYDNIYLFSLEQPGTRILVSSSFADNNVEATGNSLSPSISVNGSIISFTSSAPNLLSSQINSGFRQVYTRKVTPPVNTQIVSQNSGTEGNNNSDQSSISADGTRIVFRSTATNLTGYATGNVSQIYMVDQAQPNNITPVSMNTDMSGMATGANDNPVISGDGLHVAWASKAENITLQLDGNTMWDIFHRNLAGQFTQFISRNSKTGTVASRDCFEPSISFNGKIIAFHSKAGNLIEGDTNEIIDVFVYDRNIQKLFRVSTSTYGVESTSVMAGSDSGSRHVRVSGDGKYVVYDSNVLNLVENDGNGVRDVFITGPLQGS